MTSPILLLAIALMLIGAASVAAMMVAAVCYAARWVAS